MQSNIDKKRTILENLRRNATTGNPGIHHISPDDLRYKTWEDKIIPQSNAVIIAMMDTSGSMGSFEKYCARSFFFWMTRFLRRQYEKVEIVFLAHHTEAKEVTEEEFFTRGESGGTICSSVYMKALDIIDRRYPPSSYNIYPFHFSDGDNLTSDNERCVKLIGELMKRSNMFGYGEVNQYNRSSTLMSAYRHIKMDQFMYYVIKEKGEVYKALRSFPETGRRQRKMTDEIRDLEYAIAEIMEIADGFGLDYYPMRYEICPSDIIYTFGAYGMPTRFSHWSFGKTFHKMKMQYDFGLSKIYELVINSNPCYAFLLDGNSLIQNKLIVAHVLAHCDFFKNNARFSKSNRNMVESMAATADRISNYEMEYGTEAVESFIDAVIAIQEHVDPQLIKPRHLDKQRYMEMKMREQRGERPHVQKDDMTTYGRLMICRKRKLHPKEFRFITSLPSRKRTSCGLFRSSRKC